MTEDKRKLVVAENFHEFRRYAHENRLNISNQAVYVKDEYSTMGIDPRRVDVVWLPGAVARKDFNRIRAAMVARGCTEGLPRPVHELDGAVLGDKFRVGDQMFTLSQIDVDVEGSQQWTMVRRGSRSDREMETGTEYPKFMMSEGIAQAKKFGTPDVRAAIARGDAWIETPGAHQRDDARRARIMGDTPFDMPPGIMQGYRGPDGQSLTFDQVRNMRVEPTLPIDDPAQGHPAGPQMNDPCKCGFRAPELGPHPYCPIHGHDSPDRMDGQIGHRDEEPNPDPHLDDNR